MMEYHYLYNGCIRLPESLAREVYMDANKLRPRFHILGMKILDNGWASLLYVTTDRRVYDSCTAVHRLKALHEAVRAVAAQD